MCERVERRARSIPRGREEEVGEWEWEWGDWNWGERVGGTYAPGPGWSIAVNANGPHPFAAQTWKRREECLRTEVQKRRETRGR